LTVVARRFRIQGRVQGVGFRYFAVRSALRLGVAGWALNRADGSVEVLAQGEHTSLEELARLLEEGPAASRVDNVQSSDAPVDPSLAEFRVRH